MNPYYAEATAELKKEIEEDMLTEDIPGLLSAEGEEVDEQTTDEDR